MQIRTTKNLLILLIALVSLSGLLTQATAQAQLKDFTLKQAQDYAIRNNYQAKNAIIDVAIAARKVKENLAAGFPQVSSSISYNNFINLATQLIPAEFFGGEPGTFMEVQFGTKNNASLQGQVSQLIFNGAYFVGLKAAKTFKQMSELQLEQVENDVKQAIANAYYLVLISMENKTLMEETVSTMEKLVSDTKAMYEQGFMQDTDVDKLTLLLSDLKTNVLNAKNQIKNASYLLKFNMGMKVTDEINLTDNLETLILTVNPDASLALDLKKEEHISFRIIETQQTITELQWKLARTEFMPTVSGFLSQTENAQRNTFNFFDFDQKWFPTTLAGVQINIPIFSSGSRLQKVKQARMEMEKAQNTKTQVSESLVMGAVTAKNNFSVSVETFNNKRENFNLSKKIYNKEQIKYKNGVSSSTDLNQSYNQLLESQGNYLGAMLDMLNKNQELKKAYNNL
ncbi:MAG: TolC family protein [Bacteroidales bacterium]|nr:TolC family protein [Bacteroidales bacterium]